MPHSINACKSVKFPMEPLQNPEDTDYVIESISFFR